MAPPPPMASIMVPKDAVLIGDTAPPQLETRLGARPVTAPTEQAQAAQLAPTAEPAQAAQTPTPTVVKFGDRDTVMVTPEAQAPATNGAAGAVANNAPVSRSAPKAKKPSHPLPPNALLPDGDPPSYALPPSRGGAPKDPVAEAQLRASMR